MRKQQEASMKGISGRVRFSSTSFFIWVAFWSVAADAQMIVHFDLPSQPLARSLTAIGTATNTNVGFTASQVAGLLAPPLKADLTVDGALQRVLAGTGLRPRHLNDHTILIASAESPRTTSAEVKLSSNKALEAEPYDQLNAPRTEAAANSTDNSPPVDDRKKDLEEIVVTGSHIRGIENKTNPLLTIDQAQIEQSGYSSTQDLFQSLPQNYSSGPTTQAGFLGTGGNNSEFASAINLRGLGASSTLVLLNGHRLAPAVTGTEVDVSAIPLAAIDRVEILTDGSSAIYGSDAVGGVVNIMTKKDYDGAETSVRYGSVTAGSRKEETFAQTLGTSWSSGNVTATMQYQNHSALAASDREFASAVPSPSDLLPDDHSYAGVLTARQDLTDHVQAYADLLWSKRSFNENIGSTVVPGAVDFENNSGNSEALNIATGVRYDFTSSWSAELNALYANQDSDITQITNGAFYPTPSAVFIRAIFDEKSIDFLLNGKIAQTGGGNVGVAIGASYRVENPGYHFYENGTALEDQHPDRNVKAFYGEIYAPIFGERNSKPLLYALDLSAAVRTDEYSDFGRTTNPRVGLRWSPVSSLSFRGSYGKSFRAPTEAEIFQGLVPIVYIYSFANPSGPGTVPVIVSSASKPLTAERAKSTNFGVEYRPANIQGLDLTLNYYDIRYADRIVQVFPPFSALQASNVYGQLITHLPNDAAAQAYLASAIASGATYQGDFTGMGTAGVRYAFDAGILNASLVRQSGFDFVGSLVSAFAAGDLAFRLNASYIDKIETSYTPGASFANLVNTYGNPPRWRSRATVSWATKGWEASSAVNFIGSYVNTSAVGNPPVSSWTTIDLGARLHVEAYLSGPEWKGVTIGANVLNALDRNPPYVTSSSTLAQINYDPSNASPLGRFVSVELRKKW
jgi:iron complex outermembrane receptor protein